jgi:SnoaL-like protein
VDTVPEPVQLVLDAANRGDVEGFLDAFGAGGVVDDWGREFAGRDAIRGWSDAEFIGKQVSLDVTAVETDGARTVVTAQVGGNGFNGPSHFTFDVAGPTVTRMTIRA